MAAIVLVSCTSGEKKSDAKRAGAPRVLMVVTSHDRLGNTDEPTGAYLSEITHPYEVFESAGYEIEFVSTKGGKVPLDGVKLEDPVNRAFMDDPSRIGLLENTRTPSAFRAEDFDVIFYAGGHGTMWDFPDNAELARIAGKIYDKGGVVGAVCHGPAGLVNIKLASGQYLVAGKEVAAFTNEEEDAVGKTAAVPFLLETKLIEHGAQVRKAANFQPKVVVSERLVTGQNPASAKGVAEEIVQVVKRTR
jgi:putative intracellular protease/amidase